MTRLKEDDEPGYLIRSIVNHMFNNMIIQTRMSQFYFGFLKYCLLCPAFQIENFIIRTIADKYLIDTIFLSFEKILVLFLSHYSFLCLNKS